MTKRKNASKPHAPSNGRKNAPRQRPVASTKDVKRRPAKAVAIATQRLASKRYPRSKARIGGADKEKPSMIANQMQLLEALFRWTPLGFLMRYERSQRDQSGRSTGDAEKRK